MSATRLKKELADVGIALLIFFAIQGVLYGVLGVFPPYRVVISGSMEPTYHTGDVVFIKKMDPSALSVGDIIVFESQNGKIPVVHRVIDIVKVGSTRYFVTKGDNNPFQDTYYSPLKGVPEYKVIGKPVLRIPKIGWISIYLRRIL